MPYIEGLLDSSERWARNPETGKGTYVENMTFDEWKQQYVNNLGNSLENHAKEAKPKKDGKYEWNELNVEGYNKHVRGTKEFDNYAKGRKRPISELTISYEEAQTMINKYGNLSEKSFRKQVFFTSETYVGKWADIDGKLYYTKEGRISYTKRKGCHLTPQKPKGLII
ncbi:toxin 50 [Lactobacillus bombicola]|uniref:Toxin 50 n=1 Tax=Lactobacillus bombicola TaxID=1505723 RepID=A0A1I1RA83_9LACO|nr:polymorphic toxin type 50 domain-containing protein [Lactobacillus bombicola]SFD31047.1 toxin 50 [Lactobacillus bombicola]